MSKQFRTYGIESKCECEYNNKDKTIHIKIVSLSPHLRRQIAAGNLYICLQYMAGKRSLYYKSHSKMQIKYQSGYGNFWRTVNYSVRPILQTGQEIIYPLSLIYDEPRIELNNCPGSGGVQALFGHADTYKLVHVKFRPFLLATPHRIPCDDDTAYLGDAHYKATKAPYIILTRDGTDISVSIEEQTQ